MVLVKWIHPFQLLTTVELCVSLEWVSKFALYVSRGARKNGWPYASEADASGRRRSFIVFGKKNPIIELDCKISLAYIVCFKVNMSFSSTRGFNLEKCMHSIDADINACPWRPIWKTFVLW